MSHMYSNPRQIFPPHLTWAEKLLILDSSKKWQVGGQQLQLWLRPTLIAASIPLPALAAAVALAGPPEHGLKLLPLLLLGQAGAKANMCSITQARVGYNPAGAGAKGSGLGMVGSHRVMGERGVSTGGRAGGRGCRHGGGCK